MFSTIAGLLGSLFARFLGFSTLQWIAKKAFLITLFVFVLPRVLNNFLHYILQISFNLLNNAIGDFSVAIQITGLLAWLLEQSYFTVWFSYIISAVACRISIRLIPFIK